MEWLDAMRGFTMLLVVAYHVAQFAFREDEKISSSLPFLVLFRMPLFFFVSGYLAYKANFFWTPHTYLAQVWKKVKIQVIPTLVFLIVFLVVRSKMPLWDGLLKCFSLPTKGGYWFTWVLLQMFIIYYTAATLSQCIHSHLPVLLLWVVSLLASISLYLPHTLGKWYDTDLMMYSSFYETLKFLHFFLFGNLIHRYTTSKGASYFIEKKNIFTSLIIIIAFLSCADLFRWHFCKDEWTNLPHTLAMYTLMLTTILFFMHYQQHFTQQTRTGRTLQYIGTRTLDIYLLHFILMPRLPQIGQWLNANQPNFLIDILCSLALACPVIALCCLVSNILRISPFFKLYLFGRK